MASASVSDLLMKAEEADLYTQAIDLNPNAELFADRALANIELANFTVVSPKSTKSNPFQIPPIIIAAHRSSMASVSDLLMKAKEAFIDDHFELAVDLYSQAIDLNSSNAELFADRAQANIKLANFTEAVADANKAIQLDPSMAKAYLRKGTACIKLEEYQTAKAALQAGSSLAPGDSRFTNLIKECDQRIA
ncbi:SGT1-like protein, partial [Drosera capensis]